ncbi:MAG: DNA internalization-related competence protein ComEC/Rec2 [Thiomonas sp.]|uniref:DNA internalization-related competence protein ComEC/Rec2 n=1 Tax=Thiomonas sp. TaxID=2047785 RepID=UPI002A3672B9|nr:DNA internalization-related competence protein ComEC/Rec2 [Thiomonas sp.]MDY0331277.1 DNA internalization-related competence protein ComEC/Rec2 [Thiomonas sp.]
MPIFALAILLGCALQTAQAALWPRPMYGAMAAVGIALAAALLLWHGRYDTAAGSGRGRHRILVAFLLACSGFALAFGLTGWRAYPLLADRLDPALEGQVIAVRGVVSGLPVLYPHATRFEFDTIQAPVGVPGKVSLSWYARRTRFGPSEAAPRVHPGEEWRFSLRLKRPHGLANPGGNDTELALFREGIGATGTVSRMGAPPQLLGLRRAPADWVAQLRDHLRERMMTALRMQDAPLLLPTSPTAWGRSEHALPAAGPPQCGTRLSPSQPPPRSGGGANTPSPRVGRVGVGRAPSGLSAAAPVWPAPDWTARRGLASGEAAPCRGSQRTRALGATPLPAADTIIALALGDQSAISAPDWATYRMTGVAHLMSISGLHITLLAWLALRLTGWLWRQTARLRRPWTLIVPAPTVAAWGALLVATAYALVAGWGVPAQRTLLMLAVVLLLRQRGLRADWRDVMALALSAVLLWDPWAVRQAGFWLSFVAVGMLFVAGERRHPETAALASIPGDAVPAGRLQRSWQALRGAAHSQWVATIALLPLTLLFFQQIALLSPLANALAIPVVTLAVAPLAVGGLLLPAPLDGWAWRLGARVQQGLDAVLRQMADWPLAQWHAAAPDGLTLALAALGVLALALPWGWRLRAPGLLLLLPLASNPGTTPEPGAMEVWFADVGQGMAVVVRTARHTLLYDTGPQQAPGVDAGGRVLLPLLHSLGVRRLDRVVVSHDDGDHAGGAATLARAHPEADLLTSAAAQAPWAQGFGAMQPCAAGQRWNWDGVDFRIVSPLPGDAPRSDNARSCVLHVSARGASLLLTGDIDQAQERALRGAGLLPYADVLLVPHHGSKSSSSEALLDTVMPRAAVVQAGYRNAHGHPHPAVLARYAERGIKVWRTDRQGALQWRDSAPDTFIAWRAANPHYWSADAALADTSGLYLAGPAP